LGERKMKILGINASPKGSKSETLTLVRAVLKGAKSKGAKVEMVNLCTLHGKYCTGAIGEP
jgi:multimeric flavodoxin WrbA